MKTDMYKYKMLQNMNLCSWKSALRCLLVMLMMVAGVEETWGQTDYSGVYYIGSNYLKKINNELVNQYNPVTLTNNFYLCPTEEWAFYVSGGTVTGTDNGQPFLTTHKKDLGYAEKYKWIVEKHTINEVDYYTFRYAIDYVNGVSTTPRYMSYSSQLSGAGIDRMRIHLEITANPGDNELFSIVEHVEQGPYLVISPKNKDANDGNKTKYLTVNGGNKEGYGGESGKTGGPDGYTNTAGIIGTYHDIKDVNSGFYLEPIPDAPTFTVDASGNVTINHPVGTTVRYTTNGTTPTSSVGTVYDDNPISGVSAMTGDAIKAVVINTSSNNLVSDVASLPLLTPIYNIVDTEGRIAIKCTGTKSAVGTPLSGYSDIPAAIRSPYIADETITFYDSFTEGDLTSLGEPITTVPMTPNIYVTYTTEHLDNKPIQMDGSGFVMQVNGEYVYDNSGSFGHTTSDTDIHERNYMWKLLGGDPYRVQIQNVANAGHYFLGNTSTPELTLGADDGATSYFFLMGGSAAAPSGWVAQLELMAATGADAATAYYSVGFDGSDVVLQSNAHGNAAVQVLLDEAVPASTYHLIDKSGHIVLEGNRIGNDLGLPALMISPLVSEYHYYTADAFDVAGGVYTLKSPEPSEIAYPVDASDGHIYVTYDVSTTELILTATAAYWIKVNGNYASYFDGDSYAEPPIPPTVSIASDTHGPNLDYVWALDAEGDPYQVKVKNLLHNNYFRYDTPAADGASVDLNQTTPATAQKFFLRRGAASGKYELVALTATPLDVASTSFAVGDGGSDDLKLYASSTKATGSAELQIEFEMSTKSCTFVIVDYSYEEILSSSDIPVAPGQTLIDLLPAEIKSPLAKDWRFYKSKVESATDLEEDRETSLTVADMLSLQDSKIYVRYTPLESGDAGYVDLDGRSRGNMYLLRFTNGESFKQEDGDAVQSTPTQAIYPYNNGDYNLYIYGEAQWNVAQNGAASTRTRFPWFVESYEGIPDPYNVRIGSYQTQGSVGETTLYHAYLHTYKPDDYAHIVTGVITDNHEDITDGSTPTYYMILGTPGAFKLVTREPVDDGTTNERRTVNSFEQYWKTYETISQSGDYSPSEITNPAFAGVSLHRYQAWANARPETGGSKRFMKENHWFQTVRMDYDSSAGTYTADPVFDFVPLDFEGALILLDNHGWEVMRMPIVKEGDARNATMRAALKKYDSRLVERYHFFTDTKGAGKLSGYHKYTVDPKQEVRPDLTITSLSEFPEKLDASGTIYDLYVTYDVDEAFSTGYTGAATEAAVQGSRFIIRQGNLWAKAKDANTGEGVTTLPEDLDAYPDNYTEYFWYPMPNFNIDREMGYIYAGEVGAPEGAMNKTDLDLQNYNEGRNGFDPYNMRMKNVKYGTYATTNATTATLNQGAWSGNGTTVSLTAGTATLISAEGHDSKTCQVTNTVFMAVSDEYGNTRLMPRFDHNKVLTEFLTIAAQEDAGAFNPAHHQSIMSYLPITYHVVRKETGHEVFSYTIRQAKGTSFVLPDRDKLSDRLNCTLSTNYYKAVGCTDADLVDAVGVGGFNIYVPYTFDAATLKANTNIMFSESETNPVWMAMRFANDDAKYLSFDGSNKIVKGDADPDADAEYFAFIGDPYQFRVINRAAAADGMDAQAGGEGALNFTTHSDLANYTWSLLGPSGEGAAKFQIMLTSSFAGTRSFWDSASPVVLYSGVQRAADDLLAELEQVKIPVMGDNGRGGITLSCSTDGAAIHYLFDTTAPADPTDESPTYSRPLTNVEGYTVKAIAVKYGMRDSEVLSQIVVLNPNITLWKSPTVEVTPTTYTYDRTAKEPTVTVRKGETTIPADEYEVVYTNNTDAGTATVTLTNVVSDYYVKGSKTFTINPAVFSVTADPQSKTYGDPDPALTYVYSGLVEGDDLAEVLTGALSRVAGENARTTYDITLGTLAVNSNYSMDYTGAVLTINPKSIGNGTDPATNFSIKLDKTEVDGVFIYPNIVWQGAKMLKEGPAVDDGTEYDYYITSDDVSEPQYHLVTVHGVKNYTDSFKARFANVTFTKLEGNVQPGGAASFYTNYNADFAVPQDMRAYYVTAINYENRTVSGHLLDYIPKNEPVILLSDIDALGFQVRPRPDGIADITTEQQEANMLRYVSVDTYFNTAAIYLLFKGEFVLNMKGTLPAGKIYLDRGLSGGGGGGAPARLRIEWEDTPTTIETIPLPTSDTPVPEVWYSLDGRRLSGRPTQKGIYICNGKKVCL